MLSDKWNEEQRCKETGDIYKSMLGQYHFLMEMWRIKVWYVLRRERSFCTPEDEDPGWFGCCHDRTPLGTKIRGVHPLSLKAASSVQWFLPVPGPTCWQWEPYRRGERGLPGRWEWTYRPSREGVTAYWNLSSSCDLR